MGNSLFLMIFPVDKYRKSKNLNIVLYIVLYKQKSLYPYELEHTKLNIKKLCHNNFVKNNGCIVKVISCGINTDNGNMY